MPGRGPKFIPPLGYHLLTPLYDRVARWTLRDRAFKERLIRQAGVREGYRVLDVGCGTGTLTALVCELHPACRTAGVDRDRGVLRIARRKMTAGGLPARLSIAAAEALPFPDARFDRVLASLFFHHLVRGGKELALREARRVLRPGGELHVADWGKPASPLMRAAFLAVRLLDGFAPTADHARGDFPALIAGCGFDEVTETERWATPFGTMALYRARRAG